MKKIISLNDVTEKVSDGMTIMIGGFLGIGSPEKIIDTLCESNVKDLTLICSDTSYADKGLGKLIAHKKIKKVITSHIGTNIESGKQLLEGDLEVELVPQGTLVERIRAAGAGLGGVLTPTGIGTLVEKGKEIVEIDDKKYILEKPLKADIAIIKGSIVDELGNVWYNKVTRNFNVVMATAANTVIVEAEKMVSPGEIAEENIVTPRIFVDYIVEGE